MVTQHGCQGLLIAVLDRNPPVFDAKSHTVTLPEAFKQSVRIVQDAGWDKVSLHDAVGGQHLLGDVMAVLGGETQIGYSRSDPERVEQRVSVRPFNEFGLRLGTDGVRVHGH
jgi:hypothetical protein